MLHKFSCLIYLLFPLCLACTNPTKPGAIQPATTPVVIEASDMFTLTASNQRQYRIQIRYPGDYANQTSKKYPVILKIDGQWDFPLAASVVNNIYFDGQMPEALVIGVDWLDTSPNLQAVRMRDLSPVAVDGVEASGQAAIFAKVLAEEIVPELAKRVRANGQVYLLGGSLGANFATFALLEQPQAFSGAIAIGGSYGNSRAVYERLVQKHKGHNALENKRLYLGVGAADSLASQVNTFAEEMNKAGLTGLKIKLDVLEGYGHSGMNVPGYAAGYKYLFERPRLTLSKEYLKTLEGTYTSLDGKDMPIELRITGQGLSVMRNGGAVPLHAQSPNEFYYEGEFYNLVFSITETKINLRIESFFGASEYSRIKSL
jgi:predicted alpha/beta superfamily hydrolase